MKPQPIDYSLYLVTDRGLAGTRGTLEIVRAAVQGGVSCVQLREKLGTTRELIEEAKALVGLLRPRRIPLVINDRVDVALAVGADAVHLGQSDMPLAVARTLLQGSMRIGVSVASVDEAREAEAGGADYLGVGPIYATPTKTDTAAPLGLEGLREVRRAVRAPLVAIGGLNAGNAGEVVAHGADGIAVVSAIVAAADPERAARELWEEIARARRPWA